MFCPKAAPHKTKPITQKQHRCVMKISFYPSIRDYIFPWSTILWHHRNGLENPEGPRRLGPRRPKKPRYFWRSSQIRINELKVTIKPPHRFHSINNRAISARVGEPPDFTPAMTFVAILIKTCFQYSPAPTFKSIEPSINQRSGLTPVTGSMSAYVYSSFAPPAGVSRSS